MALVAELEALVKELEKVDPAAAKAQRDLLEKHEILQKPMKEAVLRQSDYDKFLNENKGKLNDAQKWKEWADRNLPIHEQLKTDYDALLESSKREKAELEVKVAAAAAAVNRDPDNPGTVDPAKLHALVEAEMAKKGYVSKTEMDQIIANKTNELLEPARREFLDKTFPQTALWITRMVSAQLKHREEFGKLLDESEFAKFLKDNKIADPAEGYERYVEPSRRKKEIETEAQKIADAKIDEFKKTHGGTEFPGTSGTPQPMGALQIRFADRGKDDPLIPKDAELGDGSLALAAAAELRSGK